MIRLTLLLLLFSSYSLHADVCIPRWSVLVDNNNARYDGDLVRIPIIVQTPNADGLCGASSIRISVQNNARIFVKGNKTELEGFVTSESGGQTVDARSREIVVSFVRASRQMTLWLNFNSLNSAPAGVYSNYIDFSLLGVGNSSPVRKQMRLEVPEFVSLTLQGYESRNPVVKLGKLETGQSHQFNLQLETNVAVEISVDSKNGVLKHVNGTSTIPYQVFLGNRLVKFGQKWQVHFSHRQGLRQTQNLRLKIGDTSRSAAGDYSDTLVIHATARP
ncbi:hypothetical protein BCT61_11555 [Vibrio breoganii]|uniref:hypothetical protein n=1 Tax=Vibrio breoganii TaxID=553239 RepID=UPI000C81A41F|nr:hypothetical protein [Vibrio breoganii]PMG08055.1 hypothetical protein BCV00_00675 [Vibrio breoganii]PMK26247.1 hypothetical protein BCU03_03170 [Vibrio breoganii]PMM09130.1 hypothetical protein BCT61_11555 [Vibrio breoganii]